MSVSRRLFQTTSLPSGYAPLLADLKARVRAAQVRFYPRAFAAAYSAPEFVQWVIA